ncbi:hypothetical protein C9374_010202 [Naegleria lovaniensis]|uniref:Uncharacterized protein n=1 Tax=Naegleria lovaniensis TaxID=51637 RepID=A0AA88KEN9_NAELO|nr:uncharacterized protein C9374_010202 [Naegleria lovaniensis]KAG2375198.1 hypothetical protein C9374_010202 [Naegleria lovaniensis]
MMERISSLRENPTNNSSVIDYDGESVHSKGSNHSKTSSVVLGGNTLLGQFESVAFFFLVSIKLPKPVPNLLVVLFNIMLLWQSTSLGWESEFAWGENGKLAAKVIAVPRTLGANWYPYQLFMAISIILAVLEIISMLSIYFAYKALHRGSKHSEKIKNTVRTICILFGVFGLAFVFSLTSFWACDYSTQGLFEDGVAKYALRRFPEVACWNPLNGSFAVISLVFMIIQIPLTFLGLILLSDTWVNKHTWLSMDNPFLIATWVSLNQVYLIISQALPPQAFVARPILYLIISVILFAYLVYDLPFHHRIVNSVFGGVFFSRIGVAISSIVSLEANPTNSDDIGFGILFGVGFGSFILFFIIGFAVVEIYSQVISRYVERRLRGLKNDSLSISSSLKELVNPRALFHYMKFSIKKKNDNELISNFIKAATNQRLELDTSNLIISALYIFYKLEEGHTPSFALHLLAKAAKKNTNILQRYAVYQRTKEIEADSSQGKNSLELRHILNTVSNMQEKLRQYQKLFWKHFVSNEENNEKVYNLVKMMHSLMENSTTTYNNLLVNYNNNAQVLRSYAQFLEEFLFESELAEEFYQEANILEEEDSKKRRFSVDRQDFKKRGLHSNKVVPVSLNDEDLKLNAFTESNENDVDNLESASQYGDIKKDKQTIYRSAINKPYDSKAKFLFLQSLGVVSIIVICIILGMALGLSNDGERIATVNDFCQISPVTYLALSGVRWIQLISDKNGTDYFMTEYKSHKETINIAKGITEKVKTIVNEQKFAVESMKSFVAPIITIDIPILQTGNITSLLSTKKNASVADMSGELMTIVSKIYNWKVEDYANIFQNYEFLYVWMNRIVLTESFEKFCSSLISRSDSFLNHEKQVFIFTLVGVLVVYVLFIFVFIVFSYIHLGELSKLTKLFSKLPKDIVGTVFHNLEQRSEDKIVKIERSLFSPKRTISALIGGIFVVTVVASALLLYESLDLMQSSYNTMIKIDDGVKVLQSSEREKFKLGEYLFGDSSVLGTNMKQFHKEIIEHSQNLMADWLNYRYGTMQNNFAGISGISSSIDSLIISKLNCTSNDTSACIGVDDLMDTYSLAADRFNEDAFRGTYSKNELIKRYNQLFATSGLFSTKMYSILTQYVNAFKTPNRIISPLATSISILLLLVLAYFKYLEARRFDNENHQLRRMFNFIPYDVLEQFDEIRSYILYYSLTDLKKKAKGEKFSKTKAILDAAVDGAIVLNSRTGFIDIINPSALNMLGYKHEELLGTSLLLLFSETSADKIRSVIGNMASATRSYGESFELEAKRKNGTTFPAQVSMSVSSFEKSNLISVFIKDVTSEKKHNMLIEEEKKKSDALLLNILPEQVAARLKAGETYISEKVDDTTCLFSDMVNFTKMSSGMTAIDLIQLLNTLINGFDQGINKYGLEKIKTIGDAYFAVGGLHNQQSDHPEKVLRFAMDMYSVIHDYNVEKKSTLNIRVGMHTGSVIAGCIGTLKFAYDLWGETVTLASKMESTGIPGRIQVTRQTYERVYDLFEFDERKGVEVKGKGTLTTYMLKAHHHVSPIPSEEEVLLSAREKENHKRLEIPIVVQVPSSEDLKAPVTKSIVVSPREPKEHAVSSSELKLETKE